MQAECVRSKVALRGGERFNLTAFAVDLERTIWRGVHTSIPAVEVATAPLPSFAMGRREGCHSAHPRLTCPNANAFH
jgi:hypothetical protein